MYSFPENEIVLKTIEDNIDNFSNTYVIVKSFEGHVVKKVKELYEYAVEVSCLASASFFSHYRLFLCPLHHSIIRHCCAPTLLFAITTDVMEHN